MTSPRGKRRARLRAKQKRKAAAETLTPVVEEPVVEEPVVEEPVIAKAIIKATKTRKKKTLKSLLGDD